MFKKVYLLHLLCIIAVPVYAQKWQPGRYVNIDGVINTGFINMNPKGAKNIAEAFFEFKGGENMATVKIPAHRVKYVVTEKDSFVVSHSASFITDVFLKVLIDEPIKLFAYKTDKDMRLDDIFVRANNQLSISFKEVEDKTHTGFFYTFDVPDSQYYLYGDTPNDLKLLTVKNFIRPLSTIMSNQPGIVERIRDKTIRLDNIEEWIDFYNKENNNSAADTK